MSTDDLGRLERTDAQMIRWISRDKTTAVSEIREHAGLASITVQVRRRPFQWYGHVYRMLASHGPSKTLHLHGSGSRPRGRPKKRWLDCVKKDIDELDAGNVSPEDRRAWRATVNSKSSSRRVETPQ
ncbi:hypothetical protein ACOMHN_001700 [Nucella lapillus]